MPFDSSGFTCRIFAKSAAISCLYSMLRPRAVGRVLGLGEEPDRRGLLSEPAALPEPSLPSDLLKR